MEGGDGARDGESNELQYAAVVSDAVATITYAYTITSCCCVLMHIVTLQVIITHHQLHQSA